MEKQNDINDVLGQQEDYNETINEQWDRATQGNYVKLLEDEEMVIEMSEPALTYETIVFDGEPKNMWKLEVKVHSVNGSKVCPRVFTTTSQQLLDKLKPHLKPLHNSINRVKIGITKIGKGKGTKYLVKLHD